MSALPSPFPDIESLQACSSWIVRLRARLASEQLTDVVESRAGGVLYVSSHPSRTPTILKELAEGRVEGREGTRFEAERASQQL